MHASGRAVSPLVVPSARVLSSGIVLPNNEYVREGASRVNKNRPTCGAKKSPGKRQRIVYYRMWRRSRAVVDNSYAYFCDRRGGIHRVKFYSVLVARASGR